MVNGPMDERTVRSTRVFEGRLLHVRVDEVTMANGRAATREIVEHPGAVAILAWNGERLAVVRQWRQAAGRVTTELPAGTRDPGEDPRTTAEREQSTRRTARAVSAMFGVLLVAFVAAIFTLPTLPTVLAGINVPILEHTPEIGFRPRVSSVCVLQEGKRRGEMPFVHVHDVADANVRNL